MKVSLIRNAILCSAICCAWAGAAPYTGNAPLCTPTGTSQICRVDLTDFMKSKFNWTNGKTYTSDSTNLNSPANNASTSSFRLMRNKGIIKYNYDTNTNEEHGKDETVKQGFMNHPTLPNVLLHSKTGSNGTVGGTMEVFRWSGGLDNSVYVVSEPINAGGWRSYSQSDMQWRNRGYFWADKVFDVTRNPNSSGEWVSKIWTWRNDNFNVIAPTAGMTGALARGSLLNTVMVRYYPAENSAWINEGGGLLPSTPMEILQVVLRFHEGNNQDKIRSWERYDYARQKLADGSYNYFGMIRYQSSFDYSDPKKPRAYCANGVPPAGHSVGKCGDFDMLIEQTGHYNAFSDTAEQGATVKAWYDTALSQTYKGKNDPKLTVRSNATPDDENLPYNRGGFVPAGNGNDAKGNLVVGSVVSPPSDSMLYLENNTLEQDWYIYPNGKDPLYAPNASPTNYCREGYKYLASFPTVKSYNGLNGTFETANPHWVIVCGTSTDAYFQGSNNSASEPSCASGYVSRGWFAKPGNLSMTTCLPNGSCVDATAKPYINFCVSGKETDLVYPAPNK